LKKKRTNNVIDRSKDVLGTTVLLGRVGARHAESGAMGEEERAGRGVVKLTTVVALDSLDGGAKLSACKGEKRDSGSNVSDLRRKGNVQA
jgi:hypothetical protein